LEFLRPCTLAAKKLARPTGLARAPAAGDDIYRRRRGRKYLPLLGYAFSDTNFKGKYMFCGHCGELKGFDKFKCCDQCRQVWRSQYRKQRPTSPVSKIDDFEKEIKHLKRQNKLLLKMLNDVH